MGRRYRSEFPCVAVFEFGMVPEYEGASVLAITEHSEDRLREAFPGRATFLFQPREVRGSLIFSVGIAHNSDLALEEADSQNLVPVFLDTLSLRGIMRVQGSGITCYGQSEAAPEADSLPPNVVPLFPTRPHPTEW